MPRLPLLFSFRLPSHLPPHARLPLPLPVVLLAAAVPVLLLAGRLARGALRRWRGERAAQVYELVTDLRPALLRVVGAGVCLSTATALGVLAVQTGTGGLRSPAMEPAEAAGMPAAPGALGTAGDALPVRAAPAAAAPSSSPARLPLPAAAPPATGAPGAAVSGAGAPGAGVPAAGVPGAGVPAAGQPVRFESIGHPAEGELFQAAVPGADGRPRAVRVWLPPHYADDPADRLPVLVLHAAEPGHTADVELPDVFDGLASAINLGRARPFVVVAPAGPTGTVHPCELVAAAPQALTDDAAIRNAVAGAFRALPPGPQGWAALGVAGAAPCAVAAGLTRPDLYGAVAAVSGRYDAGALVQAAGDTASGPAPQLLLAAAKDDADGLAAARGLQTALHGGKGQAGRAEVKVSDVVQDYAPDRERLRLVRLAAQYLVDTLGRPAG